MVKIKRLTLLVIIICFSILIVACEKTEDQNITNDTIIDPNEDQAITGNAKRVIRSSKIKCTDSDGGLTYDVLGTAKYSTGLSRLDRCVSSSKLREYYCKSYSQMAKRTITCSTGFCQTGKCTTQPENICNDNIDNDEDGDVDCNDTDCTISQDCAIVQDLGPEICALGIDEDGDGDVDCDDSDCSSFEGCMPLSIQFSPNIPEVGEIVSGENIQIDLLSSIGWVLNLSHSTFIDIDTSLIAWWKFNNNFEDSIGTSNGVPSGSITSVEGMRGAAYNFPTGTEYIDFIKSDTYESIYETQEFTISMWLESDTSSERIVFYDSDTNSFGDISFNNFVNGYYIQISEEELVFVYRTEDGIKIKNFFYDTDSWFHITIAYDETGTYIYLNGVLEDSLGPTEGSIIQPSRQTARIGKDYVNPGFQGSLDDVLIWNRALTSSEIASLYDAQTTPYSSTFTSLPNGEHNITAYTQDQNGNLQSIETWFITN